MKKQFVFYFFMGLSLLVLPNCAKYQPSTLPHPTGDIQESEDIKIVTRKLSKAECATCFDSDAVASKLQAIQIYVKNKSDKSVVLSSNNISLPIENSKNVAKKIHRKTAGRVAAYGAGALIAWPLFIPAAVDGAKSSKANSKINQDVKVKVLGQNEQEIIKPHNAVNKIVFVPHDQMKDHFNVVLTDENATQIANFTCSA